jgi:hypothetical protein
VSTGNLSKGGRRWRAEGEAARHLVVLARS